MVRYLGFTPGKWWRPSEVGQHFGEATRILDWPHLPHLWRATQTAVRAARPGKACKSERKRLYEQLRGYLWRGQVDEAVGVLAGMRTVERVEALEAVIGYIQGQRDWIGDYRAWRQEGYPVGSGMIERPGGACDQPPDEAPRDEVAPGKR